MKGSALIAAFILVVIGSLIVSGFLFYVSRESSMTKKLNDSIKAFYIAEAGLEAALSLSNEDWNNGENFELNSIAETDFSDGTYEVTESWVTVDNKKQIKSYGSYNDEVRVVNADVYLDPDINFYDQSIAAGGTQEASKIKGNVKIMGSVYVIGEEPFVDSNENNVYNNGEDYIDVNEDGVWGPYLSSSDYAIRLGGTAEIGNNYGYMPSDLSSRVPSIYNVDDAWDTLNAKVLVKYGKVSLESNSASIGEAENLGDGEKNYMDQVIVPDTVEIQNGNMYTDEYLYGADKRSMFRDDVRMVSVRDAYTDSDTGTFYASPANPYSSDTLGGYEEYLYDVANDAGDPDRGVFINGDLTITPTSVFSYGDVSDPTKSSITMDGSGNLTINGLVYINGSLTFDKVGPHDDLYYSGRGSFYVRGYRDSDLSNDVVVNLNILTQDVYNGAFPDNALGVMTRENIYFSGANNHVAGAFYAEQTITMTKQYEIAGCVIATYFDMTDQVPSIFQIPDLADNRPPYMIDAIFDGNGPMIEDWYESYEE